MKAVVYEQYGSPDVLQLKDVAKPTPKDGEVLVKIRAVAINIADWGVLNGKPFMVRMASGLLKPKNPTLGADIAGQIEAIGSHVTQFQVGDAVFGDISSVGWGGLAEYVAVPETALVLKPANIAFEEAAAVPMAGVTALQGIRKGNIQAGQKVLINGASGGVGTFAVQIAKALGAEVTAVCSTRNLDNARAMGADHVMDYTQEDFTQNGHCYDVIIGANGYHSLTDYKRALNPQGTYVCTGGTMPQIFQSMLLGPLMSIGGDKKLMNMGVAQPNQTDLLFMRELLEAGKIKPVIDRRYPLSESAEAFRYLGDGHAQGKVVITVA